MKIKTILLTFVATTIATAILFYSLGHILLNNSYYMIRDAVEDYFITHEEEKQIYNWCGEKKRYYVNFFQRYQKSSWSIFELSAFYKICPTKILYENQNKFLYEDDKYFFSFVIGMLHKKDVNQYWNEGYFQKKITVAKHENVQIALKCLLFKEYKRKEYLPELIDTYKRLSKPLAGNDPCRIISDSLAMTLYETNIISKNDIIQNEHLPTYYDMKKYFTYKENDKL